MKKSVSRIGICILFLMNTCFNISSQDIVELTYSDTFDNSSISPIKCSSLSKAKRISRNSGSITIINEDELSEEIYKSVDYAVSIWEQFIGSGSGVFISVESCDIEEDVRTVVRYVVKDNILYPLALKARINNELDRSLKYQDGIIKINSGCEWDYCIGENINPEGKNLAYAIMRAIARILGFGSNVNLNDDGEYYFSDKRTHTIFNTKVCNSSRQFLSSIEVNKGQPSLALKSYVDKLNDIFYVSIENEDYQLSSAPFSKDMPPFVYLENTQSLMGKNINKGNYILQIDEDTNSILRALGWEKPESSSLYIISEDIPDSGLASAYESHKFHFDNSNGTFTDPQWMLSLPLANGDYENLLIQDNCFSCEVPVIADPRRYKINSSGDIAGRLRLKCRQNGKEIEAVPFKIYFGLRPLIEYAVIENIEDNYPNDSYNAYYKVKYRGADEIKVSVEEEYSSRIKTTYLREPYIARGCANNVMDAFNAWIDFTAENQYGSSLYTIELGPEGEVIGSQEARQTKDIIKGRSIEGDLNYTKIELFDGEGNKVGSIRDLSDIDCLQYRGMLIVRMTRADGTVKTIKKELR